MYLYNHHLACSKKAGGAVVTQVNYNITETSSTRIRTAAAASTQVLSTLFIYLYKIYLNFKEKVPIEPIYYTWYKVTNIQRKKLMRQE